jgi:hypothetical protein
MSTESQTISSLDSISAADTFESIYSLMNKLKDGTTVVRDGLKGCHKRYADIELGDRLFSPKPHAAQWFTKQKLEVPCELDTFLKVLFNQLGEKRLVCHRTRTLILPKAEAELFQMNPNYAYRWIEVLQNLPNIFY